MSDFPGFRFTHQAGELWWDAAVVQQRGQREQRAREQQALQERQRQRREQEESERRALEAQQRELEERERRARAEGAREEESGSSVKVCVLFIGTRFVFDSTRLCMIKCLTQQAYV